MAITNRERIGKAMDLLKEGLGPFVEREFLNLHRTRAADVARQYFHDDNRLMISTPIKEWDAAALLSLMTFSWNDVFRQTLGYTERSLVGELRDWRNKWAHQEAFSSEDTGRALDSAARLPEAWQWVLSPTQKEPGSPIEWQASPSAATN